MTFAKIGVISVAAGLGTLVRLLLEKYVCIILCHIRNIGRLDTPPTRCIVYCVDHYSPLPCSLAREVPSFSPIFDCIDVEHAKILLGPFSRIP